MHNRTFSYKDTFNNLRRATEDPFSHQRSLLELVYELPGHVFFKLGVRILLNLQKPDGAYGRGYHEEISRNELQKLM